MDSQAKVAVTDVLNTIFTGMMYLAGLLKARDNLAEISNARGQLNVYLTNLQNVERDQNSGLTIEDNMKLGEFLVAVSDALSSRYSVAEQVAKLEEILTNYSVESLVG